MKWINSLIEKFKNRNLTPLEKKIKEADQKHRETGKRYHVLPNTKDELVVVDNNILVVYNKRAKRLGKKQLTIVDILKMSYYSTK